MDCKQIFDKYYSKLATEGIIKSILCALAIGLGAAFAVSFVFWVTDFKYFWISIIIGAAIVAAVTPAFYFRLFRPTAKSVAHRVDRLGLEERIITMTELENDQSYIAMRQREDAQAALVAARDKKIKLKISARIVVAASVVAVAFFAMLLINIFSSNGVMPKASEIFPNDYDKEMLHTVSYLVEGEGNIIGETDQIVMEGDSTSVVVAVAEEGWYFVMWSDENENAERYEFNVIDDMEITAIFEELGESDGEPGDGEPGDGEPGDGEGEDPGEPSDSGENGNSSSSEPGKPSGPNNSGDESDNKNPGEDEGPGAGGGDGIQNDTFIDGNTPIKDYYQEYYEQAMKMLADGQELPEDLRKIVEGYYEGIKP